MEKNMNKGKGGKTSNINFTFNFLITSWALLKYEDLWCFGDRSKKLKAPVFLREDVPLRGTRALIQKYVWTLLTMCTLRIISFCFKGNIPPDQLVGNYSSPYKKSEYAQQFKDAEQQQFLSLFFTLKLR